MTFYYAEGLRSPLTAKRLRPTGFFSRCHHGLELSPGFYQFRLFQTLT